MKNITFFLAAAISLVAVKASADVSKKHKNLQARDHHHSHHSHHHHHHHHHSSSHHHHHGSSGFNWGVGMFLINVIDQDGKLFLNNNKFYEGAHNDDKSVIRSWKPGDQVQVVGTKYRSVFLIRNLRTNKFVKTHQKSVE